MQWQIRGEEDLAVLQYCCIYAHHAVGGVIFEDGSTSTHKLPCGAKLILGVFVELCYSFQILLNVETNWNKLFSKTCV